MNDDRKQQVYWNEEGLIADPMMKVIGFIFLEWFSGIIVQQGYAG